MTNEHMELLQHEVELVTHDLVSLNHTNLHKELIRAIEPVFLRTLMKRCQYNQVRASNLSGISRSTLRTKLKKYFGSEYL